jgi:hypothetical protein
VLARDGWAITLEATMNRRSRTRRRTGACLVAVVALTAVAPLSAGAAPGDPVTTFGDDGLAVVAEGRPPTFDIAADAVRMNDGSILMVGSAFAGQKGDIVVAKVGVDRRLVESFGSGGRLQISRPDRTLVATGMARHGTGVVVVGLALGIASSEESVVVMKVTANGRLDTTFDGDGIRFLEPGTEVDHRTIAVSRPVGSPSEVSPTALRR